MIPQKTDEKGRSLEHPRESISPRGTLLYRSDCGCPHCRKARFEEPYKPPAAVSDLLIISAPLPDRSKRKSKVIHPQYHRRVLELTPRMHKLLLGCIDLAIVNEPTEDLRKLRHIAVTCLAENTDE